jgi:uncharacterized cofD-like protein
MQSKLHQKVVIIGGGTGTYVTVSGLKAHNLDVTAIISVADSGGSTGRLRDEFGFLPVGDLRQALAALANDNQHDWIRNLLLYRFAKGSGLEGHNLGNLLLTALQDMTGSTPKALETAANIFRLKGNILPITTQNIQLVIEYEDGTVEIGENVLDHKHGGKKIIQIKTSPRASIYQKAREAIIAADCIIIGPGDIYGSIAANLVVDGVSQAFKISKAKLVYISNLMTRYTQTHNMTAGDHVRTIESYLGRPFDFIIMNSAPIPPAIQKLYQAEHEYPVKDDLGEDPRVVRSAIIKPVAVPKAIHDGTPRSYLRHEQTKLAATIMKIITRK